MRRLPLAALVRPDVSVRTGITGFNIFCRETQKNGGILTASTFRAGQQNMRLMARDWRSLPKKAREDYNKRAALAQVTLVEDLVKKNNPYNLVMQILYRNRALGESGDSSFISRVARSTVKHMKEADAHKLYSTLKVERPLARPRRVSATKGSSYVSQDVYLFSCPDMKYFNSFTEMQHSVAPTRQSLYVHICATQHSGSYFTAAAQEASAKRLKRLPAHELRYFEPISPEEAPRFEMFCYQHCAGLDPTRMDILRLFATFRGMVRNHLRRNKKKMALFKSITQEDRAHEGVYHKAHRALLKMRDKRSSDCGILFAVNMDDAVSVEPSTYSLDTTMSDVEVATLLAYTRHSRSVYDDVISRANILRSEAKNIRLGVYNVDVVLKNIFASAGVSLEKRRVKKVARRKAKVTAAAKAVVPATETQQVTAAKTAKAAAPANKTKKKCTAKVQASKRTTRRKLTIVAPPSAPAFLEEDYNDFNDDLEEMAGMYEADTFATTARKEHTKLPTVFVSPDRRTAEVIGDYVSDAEMAQGGPATPTAQQRGRMPARQRVKVQARLVKQRARGRKQMMRRAPDPAELVGADIENVNVVDGSSTSAKRAPGVRKKRAAAAAAATTISHSTPSRPKPKASRGAASANSGIADLLRSQMSSML